MRSLWGSWDYLSIEEIRPLAPSPNVIPLCEMYEPESEFVVSLHRCCRLESSWEDAIIRLTTMTPRQAFELGRAHFDN
jgi:hypothetical protein